MCPELWAGCIPNLGPSPGGWSAQCGGSGGRPVSQAWGVRAGEGAGDIPTKGLEVLVSPPSPRILQAAICRNIAHVLAYGRHTMSGSIIAVIVTAAIN